MLSKSETIPWMFCFPHAVKDFAAVKGIRKSMGSPISNFEGASKKDNKFVERLRDSHVIFIGKTNIPEFAAGSNSYNPVFGATGNAYNPCKTSGGSSGGASAALAVQMLPVSDGSDMMGSLRNPAGWNNIIGFRPSAGRVPACPSAELFMQQLGYDGPMARNVQDVAWLLSTMAGYDSCAPLSIKEDPAIFKQSLETPITPAAKKKVLWLGNLNGYLPIEEEILTKSYLALKNTFKEQMETQVDRFPEDFEESSGGSKEDKEFVRTMFGPANMEKIWKTWLNHRHLIFRGILDGLYSKETTRKQLKPELIYEMEGLDNYTALQTFKASIDRSKWYKDMTKLLKNYDAIILPSAQISPFNKDIHWPEQINGEDVSSSYHRWMEVTIYATLTGLPVINVPAGFSSEGLPIGIQMIGADKEDLNLLKLAHQYEKAFEVHRHEFKPIDATWSDDSQCADSLKQDTETYCLKKDFDSRGCVTADAE